MAAARLSDGLSAGLRVRGAQGCIGALFLDLLHSSSLFSAVRGARTATAAVRMRGGGRLQLRVLPQPLRMQRKQEARFVSSPAWMSRRLVRLCPTHGLQGALMRAVHVAGVHRTRASAHAGCPGAQAEIEQIVQIGYLNGLFVLARAIGLIGHALDQKRLQQGLYRHPWEAVLYI